MTPPEATRSIWDFWAPRYESLWVQRSSLRPSRRLIHEHLLRVGLSPCRVLDVGCGMGQLARELAERFPKAQVLGMDTSQAMIEQARVRNNAPNVEYRAMRLERLQGEEPFDLVVSTHALPYMSDPEASIHHMASLLRPGGRLLVIHANTDTLYDRVCMLFVKLTTTRARYHSSAALRGMMDRAGLSPGVLCSIEKASFMPSIHLVEGLR